ncbi:uncharacterized protein LOC117593342 [Esox lucius]|uniref:uncharacterized protein LOC117593342 n=1 Tax=Esox lucius TaxID=8010 RepID=UPI00147736EB|nr:uncharacterized protein LOC117593342 [Esox lucius]
MPYSDEEYPSQSLAQSVVLFCCKGMIEGIMVILFLWLLLQVLFTKQLEGMVRMKVHLQVLLLVGLVTFCLSLILGCLVCWRRTKICPLNDPATPPAPPLTGPGAAPGVQTQSPTRPNPPQAESTLARQQYDELDGSVRDFPSTFSTPTPSDSDDDAYPTLPLSACHFFRRASSSVHREQHPKSYFPLRRLSTPSTSSPLYRQMTPHRGRARASFPSLPRLGLLSKTCQVLERRRTITGDHLHHTIPLHNLQYGSTCRASAWPTPTLHFSMAFSPERGSLTVTVLSLSGASRDLGDVSVMGSLAPLGPCPLQASRPRGPSSNPVTSPDPHTLGLTLEAGSLEELQRSVLRLSVHTQDLPSVRGSPLGSLEVQLWGEDWKAEHPIHCNMELIPFNRNMKKSQTDQDARTSRELSCGPQVLGQLLILLQYQTLAHRLKATVLRADNLATLTQTQGAPEYHVVVNLLHEGVVIDSKERKRVGGASKKWNAPFIFDLPPGDVATMSLILEFIVMQEQDCSNSMVLGKVLIGSETPEAGRFHWKDVCQGQVERARWHNILSEPL